jgi:hypothetical protein
VWAQIKRVNYNKYILFFVHVCVCVCVRVRARARLCGCVYDWMHMQMSSSVSEYSSRLHARFLIMCYCFVWPATDGSDSNKFAFYVILLTVMTFLHIISVSTVYLWISISPLLKILLCKFIDNAVLTHSFCRCQSYPVADIGNSFHPFMFAEASAHTNMNWNLFNRENYCSRDIKISTDGSVTFQSMTLLADFAFYT